MIALLIGLFISSTYALEHPFLRTDRIEYIDRGLNALLDTPNDQILNTYRYLRSLRSNLCISVSKQLEVQCLIEKAKKNCRSFKKSKRLACEVISDSLTAALLEESRIVTRSRKARLAKENKTNLGEAIQTEIERHYAVIALDLMASNHWSCQPTQWKCVSRAIHDYCDHYTLSRKGSWQGCASGLIYFIGSSHKRGPNG